MARPEPGSTAVGGAILDNNTGSLDLVSCRIFGSALGGNGSSNNAPGGAARGGAIYNASSGTINITNTTIDQSLAFGGSYVGSNGGGGGLAAGGAIYNAAAGKINVTGSTILTTRLEMAI